MPQSAPECPSWRVGSLVGLHTCTSIMHIYPLNTHIQTHNVHNVRYSDLWYRITSETEFSCSTLRHLHLPVTIMSKHNLATLNINSVIIYVKSGLFDLTVTYRKCLNIKMTMRCLFFFSEQPFSLVLPEVSNTKSYIICTSNMFVLFLLISLTVNVNFGTFVQTEVFCFCAASINEDFLWKGFFWWCHLLITL